MTTFTGTNGADTANTSTVTGFTGGTAADLLDANDDTFDGLGGDDVVSAGATNDTLNGGAGDDSLTGNGGADVFVAGIGNDTITDFGARYFTATLNAANQVPVTSSTATGSAMLVLSRAQVLTLNLSTTGLDFDGAQTPGDSNDNVSGFHIHAGAAGVNGGIVWDIQGDPDTVVNAPLGTVTSQWSGAALAANLAALGSDGLYVNIHTTEFPNGAIRGQVDETGAGPDKIDLSALNIGSFDTWQAITADLAGSAKMTTVANGVTSTLTTTGVAEALFTASDFIFAGTVAQTLDGTVNADDLFGAGGNDILNGNDGADRLFGEADNDTLNGGIGADRLVGGLGKDIMTGGADTDIFDFNLKTDSLKGGNRDVILDFVRGLDDIDLHDIDAKRGAGNQDFKFIGKSAFHHKAGELHYVVTNKPGTAHDKVIVEGDIDGNGKADFQIQLSHITKLGAGDFVL
jgi:Ca2+-binding RTX toxin-like protein